MIYYSGPNIPTTNVWDVSDIQALQEESERLKELLVRLYQNLNNMSIALNEKDSGCYFTLGSANGQSYFPNPTLTSASTTTPISRQVIRIVINFGALPNATTKSVAHNLTPNSSWSFTRIYACASDTTGFNYIPIPYASPTLINNIELKVDSTNVTIITGSNRSNFNICYVVLEYIVS